MKKLVPFLFVMSVMFLADAILADFAPGFLESLLQSPFLMGLVMSCSSLAGITLDFLFAQMLRGFTVRKMMFFPIAGGVLFALLLLLARLWPLVLILVGAMVIWGLYYEFFGFATQQYVSEVAPPHGRASAWGYVTFVKSAAYMVGPVVGAWLLAKNENTVLWTTVVMMGLAYVLLQMIKIPNKPVVVEAHEIDLRSELDHWKVLLVHIWPLLLLSVFMGLVDAFFWTNGTIINDRLAKESYIGGFFLSTYMFPSLIAPFILSKINVQTGKKRISLVLVFMSGLVLGVIAVFKSIYWYLAVVFVASLLLALAWPIVDAVYTDLLTRMGRERKHLIGLGNSTMSLAYVAGPFLSGSLAQFFGEMESFSILGFTLTVTSLTLLFVTPRKLRLPQTEINAWD